MRNKDLDRLLEQAVANALGLSLPPVSNLHRRAHGKPLRAYPRKSGHRALVISAPYHRVARRAHA